MEQNLIEITADILHEKAKAYRETCIENIEKEVGEYTEKLLKLCAGAAERGRFKIRVLFSVFLKTPKEMGYIEYKDRVVGRLEEKFTSLGFSFSTLDNTVCISWQRK